MAVRTGLGVAHARPHIGLKTRRHRVLELFGLLVHVVPGDAHDVGEEPLDHAVAADDVLRVLAAVRSEVDRPLAVAHDIPVALQPPHATMRSNDRV